MTKEEAGVLPADPDTDAVDDRVTLGSLVDQEVVQPFAGAGAGVP